MKITIDTVNNEPDTRSVVTALLEVLHGRGTDGQEIAKGALAAVREFVIENIGAENAAEELWDLAQVFRGVEGVTFTDLNLGDM